MGRGVLQDVPEGFVVQGTCQMCHSLSGVREYATRDGNDRQRLCGDCGRSTKKAKTLSMSSSSSTKKKVVHRSPLYVEIDLKQLKSKSLWRSAFPRNYAVLVADVPWENVSGNTSQRTSRFPVVQNAELLQMAAHGWKYAFAPSEEESVGLICLWCTTDSQALALQAMALAGYAMLHRAVWLKTTSSGKPYPYTAQAKCNMETVLFGIKGARKKKKRTQYMERCFHGPSYMQHHSSKPLAFYGYLRWFLGLFFIHEIDYDACQKLELFSRHATEGWTSAGNDFHGERTENSDTSAPWTE